MIASKVCVLLSKYIYKIYFCYHHQGNQPYAGGNYSNQGQYSSQGQYGGQPGYQGQGYNQQYGGYPANQPRYGGFNRPPMQGRK